MRKKLVPLALALALCLGLTVPAFATDMKLEKFTPTVEGWLADCSEGLVVFGQEKVGFVDRQGKIVVPAQYDRVLRFSKGLAAVQQNGKWGYIDRTGNEVIPCSYEAAHSFSEGLAPVKQNGKWGYIDRTGKEVVPCSYEEAYDFSEGLAAVQQNGKWGYIDKIGEEIVPCSYEDTYGSFSEGFVPVKQNGKWGYIDRTGKEVVPCSYEEAYNFSEGLAAMKKDGKWGYIDPTGKVAIDFQYDSADSFSEGLALVSVDHELCYINTTGKVAIDLEGYTTTRSFSEGLAAVFKNGKAGYIDKTGKLVIPCKYDAAGNFSGGFATVGISARTGSSGTQLQPGTPVFQNGFIDKTGKEVVPPTTYTEGDVEYFERFTDPLLRFWGGWLSAERRWYGDTPPESRYAYYALTVDAKVSDWAREQVDLAAADGLMPDGLGDDFTAKITRAEFAALAVKLYEAMGGYENPAVEQNPFSDTTDPVTLRANALGIVQGANGKFRPDDLVSRQDAAVMLSRVYTKLGGELPVVAATSFADDSAIADYAKSAVAFMADNGIITGKGNNTFAPKGQNGNASIEEAMVIALRMLENLY